MKNDKANKEVSKAKDGMSMSNVDPCGVCNLILKADSVLCLVW